jgi:penicillin amidase
MASMMTELPSISYDTQGIPAVWADNIGQAYYGMGWLHGYHRPLQTLLLGNLARGQLCERIAPTKQLLELDSLVHRLDIPERGRAEFEKLDSDTREWLVAFTQGLERGLEIRGRPLELKVLFAKLAAPDIPTVLSSLLVSGYMGLAQGQERMEHALVDALREGAEPALLERLFRPHLDDWQPSRLRQIPTARHLGFSGLPFTAVGGSNAWAVAGDRTHSGKAMLCGDPHLQVNQMPSLFFELRARVGESYWLGASIPGLPGIAVGRNESVAWSGTFGVADNTDWTVEEIEGGVAKRKDKAAQVVERKVEVGRRFIGGTSVRYQATDRGVIFGDAGEDGQFLATRWAGVDKAAEAVAAYMRLPMAKGVDEADSVLSKAHTMSLHFVLADAQGEVRYRQAGRIPKREGGGGLTPHWPDRSTWRGFYEGDELPREQGGSLVVSANEGRLTSDGAVLSTLAQPDYRYRRIEKYLLKESRVDVASMKALQLDVLSPQAQRFLPFYTRLIPPGPLLAALARWDARYGVESEGAHAFEIAHRACLDALAPRLGGDWFSQMLDASELGIWWCSALDDLLYETLRWGQSSREPLVAALASISGRSPEPWGEVHKFSMPNMILGGLPGALGLDRGPFPLPGCRATVRQGNVLNLGGAPMVVAPAYRMVCDFSEPGCQTSIAGGIDGTPRTEGYAKWLDEWLGGGYHRLIPPQEHETRRTEL